MKGVLLCALLVVALMVAVKDGRVLRKAGLTGDCTAIAAPAGQDGDWERCTDGKLQGAPNLSRHGCVSVQRVGKLEYWRCPAQIGAGPNT